MGLLDAIAFLTRVPVPARSHERAPDLARTSVWFPGVGALLGALLVALALVLERGTSALVAVVIVVAVELGLTGALHLDGLADTADGLGGADRASRLRIMKDHATGVYGAAAVALALLLEVALLLELLSAVGHGAAGRPWWLPEGAPGWPVVVLAGTAAWSLSRAAMLPVALVLPTARPDGTGHQLIAGLGRGQVLTALVLPLALCVLLGLTGLAMLAGAAAAAVGVGMLARRTLGGATGDILGATAQLALLGSLLGLSLSL